MLLPKRVPWGGGLGLLIGLAVAGCANSPSDELVRAQTELIRLEKSGADAYMPEQLASVRQNLRSARELIKNNRFERASESLQAARKSLSSCATRLVELRGRAKSESLAKLRALTAGLDSLGTLLQGVPRQSYLDQNRYDVHSSRLGRLRQEMSAVLQDIERNDYLRALQRETVLERHLSSSLAILHPAANPPVLTVSTSSSRSDL